jgi:hypothetical protein
MMAGNEAASAMKPEAGNPLFAPVALMALMGAFYWAIRGSSGYGGMAGGAYAGLGWALIWYWLANRDGCNRPYASGWTVLAIALGIALGGNNGYGIFISWINHRFYLFYQGASIPAAAWPGYAGLFLCGLQWGGVAGVMLAWSGAEKPVTRWTWPARIAAGAAGAALAYGFTRLFPQCCFPKYGEGFYDNFDLYPRCEDVAGIIRQMSIHLGCFGGWLVLLFARGERRGAKLALLLAFGFAAGFTVFAFWQLMYGSALRIDWWKNWEMSIGLTGGAAFGLAFYCFNRPGYPAAPVRFPRGKRLFGFWFPVWLGGNVLLIAAMEGMAENFNVTLDRSHYTALLLLITLPSTILYIVTILRVMVALPPEEPAAFPKIAIMQAILIVLGYLVSFQAAMNFALWLLILCYTVYIGLSAAVLLRMRYCGQKKTG